MGSNRSIADSGGASRAQARSAAKGGTSTSSRTPIERQRQQDDNRARTTDPARRTGPIATFEGVRYINDPIPRYTPYLIPGVRGKKGVNLYRGLMTALDVVELDQTTGDVLGPSADAFRATSGNTGFRFHFNPAQIRYSLITDAALSLKPTNDTTPSPSTAGAYDFSFMINRQEEVAYGVPFPNLTRQATNFASLGTVYDLEFLFRVLNQNLFQGAATVNGKAGSFDYGFLNAGQVIKISFNDAIDIQGIVRQLDITHLMFNAKMIPTVTQVDMGIMTLTDNVPTSAPPPAAKPSTSSKAPQRTRTKGDQIDPTTIGSLPGGGGGRPPKYI